MTKAEQFLWCVQTALLNNQLVLARQFETPELAAHLSFKRVNRITATALNAASQIPDDVDVPTAVKDFCTVHFDNLWYEGYKAADWVTSLPAG